MPELAFIPHPTPMHDSDYHLELYLFCHQLLENEKEHAMGLLQELKDLAHQARARMSELQAKKTLDVGQGPRKCWKRTTILNPLLGSKKFLGLELA